MGSSQSALLTTQGQAIGPRHCILLVTPPSYQVSKLVSQIPSSLGYEYVSVGQMIRDEINKKTNYSRIILQNLEKDHKINENILDILLKNAALLGNFIIKFSPRDKEEFGIWKKFVSKVTVDLAVVIQADADQSIMKRQSYRQKLQSYQEEVQQIKGLVSKKTLLICGRGQSAAEKIIENIKHME